MIINNKILVGLILSIGLVIFFGIFYVVENYFFKKIKVEEKQNQKQELAHGLCLEDNEYADYKIEKKNSLADVIIFIYDKSTKKELFSFKIENIFKTSTSVELHKCGVYVIRMFNYDPTKTEQNPGYSNEIWMYDYNGNGKSLILLSEKLNEFMPYYSLTFRVDFIESHIVLEKGYLGQDDYALVIKDLNTKEDIFALLAKDIVKQYPNIIGGFKMRGWSKDSYYFWGHIFEGAYVRGYFRIDTQNWKVDIFEVPNGAMGGLPLNINAGYAVIQPGYIWTGIEELTQELKEQYREEGRKSHLYIYNLFTKEKILIETVDEPLWSFKSRWISDAELQYELPNGEKKIYIIENSTNY